MRLHYRFVGFGVRFEAAPGHRSNSRDLPQLLFENEVAVDVGGSCWGYDDDSSILDHHFERAAGQFPSAAAAVLHNASRIYKRFHEFDDVWVVTHDTVDFDALASMYLVRELLSDVVPHDQWDAFGLRPDGWYRSLPEEINWFDPDVVGWEPNRRWPALLAGYASCVDNCRRLSCPKNRGLHSILYAALQRGRDYTNEDQSAAEFFDEVQQALKDESLLLNPLYDSVLAQSHRFSPELTLLDREIDAYNRDLQRARTSVVFVRRSERDFQTWLDEARSRPLLLENNQIAREQLCLDQKLIPLDGIYVRDPECLLFKEWARQDLDNSSMGDGFRFTAVAYTNGRAYAAMNKTDYFFAIDPERADGCHLYNVWSRLQSREALALRSRRSESSLGPHRVKLQAIDGSRTIPSNHDSQPRPGYEGRAGTDEAAFIDPWFDGVNYCATIVATPNGGTCIGPTGRRSDLMDDPITDIVRQELEYSIFASPVSVSHFPCTSIHDRTAIPFADLDIGNALSEVHTTPLGHYRFVAVALHDNALSHRGTLDQIGKVLWRLLEGVPDESMTAADVERQLVHSDRGVGVWSRNGCAVAYSGFAHDKVEELTQWMRELAAISIGTEDASQEEPASANHEERLTHCENLVRRAARAKHYLASPDNRLLAYFFDASRLDEVLQTLRDLSSAAAQRTQVGKSNSLLMEITELQAKVEWVEIFVVAVYTAELFHHLGNSFDFYDPFVGGAIVVGPIVAAIIAYRTLRPQRHFRFPNGLRALVWALVMLIAYFIGGYVLETAGYHGHERPHSEPPPTAIGATR